MKSTKLAAKAENPSITRDVSGEGVQQASVEAYGRHNCQRTATSAVASIRNRKFLQVDTTNILFICGGAFAGLEKDYWRSPPKAKSIGFGAPCIRTGRTQNRQNFSNKGEPEDLLKFGLIPEFVGRLPVIGDARGSRYRRIGSDFCRKPKNALVKQYRKLFELEDVGLTFTEDALVAIGKKAIERKTGARGLRSIGREYPARYHV